MGMVLALGFAARARLVPTRLLDPLLRSSRFPRCIFTFSRGGWAALVVGLAIAVALESRRLQLLSTMLVLSPFVAIGRLVVRARSRRFGDRYASSGVSRRWCRHANPRRDDGRTPSAPGYQAASSTGPHSIRRMGAPVVDLG